MFCGGCFVPTVRCDGQLRLDQPQTSSNRRGKPFRNRRKGAFALCNGTCRRPFALFCGFLRQGESCPPNVRGKSERPFRSCAYISKTERCLRSVFCLRLIAEKQTCFCGLKIVILPFCPKACGSLLPTAFLTCAKKRVISENCPYSIVDISASGCDKYVRILVRLLFQRLKRLGYVRLFVGFVSYVVVAINFEVVFVLLFFHYGFHFFYP